jgi:hypothetical protein
MPKRSNIGRRMRAWAFVAGGLRLRSMPVFSLVVVSSNAI